MLFRPMLSALGAAVLAMAGARAITQEKVVAVTADNYTILARDILDGIIDRTATANTADVLPTVDSICEQCPELVAGDSFRFMIRMLSAHTETLTAGAGMTLVGTTSIAASLAREYLVTMVAPGRTNTYSLTTSIADATEKRILRGGTFDQLKNIRVGMAVTGTGIGASAVVTAVNLSDLTVRVSVDSTAAATNAITFTPTATVKGLWTAAI